VTRPVYIDCESVAGVGSPEELARRAKAGSHVVLRFASLSPDQQVALIGRLSGALPDHSVFFSGGGPNCPWITVMPVVSRVRILERRAIILKAVEEHRRMTAMLAEQHRAGMIPAEWRQGEHGGHCRCENRRTGQVVEVPVREWVDPERIDPFFFAKFVKTTKGLEPVAELISHDFHDAARILDVVEC
jgi:hypothetical protein